LARSIPSKKIKVCIVTTAFPRYFGDSRAPFLYEAAKSLYNQGLNICVVAIHSPEAATHEWMEGIEVFRPRYLPVRWEILQRESGGLPLAWKSGWISRLAIIPFLLVHIVTTARIARNCDLIHANWTLSAFAAWASSFWHHKPYIVTIHGSDIYQATKIPGVKTITRFALNRSRKVIAPSISLSETAIAFGLNKKKSLTIPDGVDIEVFTPGPEKRPEKILFVGSLIKRKGVNFLLEAFSKVTPNFPNTELLIVGEGSEKDDLLNLAEKLGIQSKVTFLGSISPTDVKFHMQQARVFVLPSIEEGLGVVLLEALACGTPCVGSRVGGIPDVLNANVGILITPGDIHGLAQAICEILSDSNNWSKMSFEARKRAESIFSWKKIASQIVKEYDAILATQA